MNEIDTTYEVNGGWIDKKLNTKSGRNSPAVIPKQSPYIHLRISVGKKEIRNDASDDVTVIIETTNGIEVCRGAELTNASVLGYNGTVKIRINEEMMMKEISDGVLSFGLKTEKPSGTSIEITAESLSDDPAESDSATIEVVGA